MPGMIQQRWLTMQRYFSLVPYLAMLSPWCIPLSDVWPKPFYTSSHADLWALSDPFSYTIHLWIMNLPYFCFFFLFFAAMNIGRSFVLIQACGHFLMVNKHYLP